MSREVFCLVLALLVVLSSCSTNKLVFSDRTWEHDQQRCLIIDKARASIYQYESPERRKRTYQRNTVDRITTRGDWSKAYPMYSLIQKSIRAIPSIIDSVYFIVNDTYLVAKLKPEHIQWRADSEDRKDDNKYVLYGMHVYGQPKILGAELPKGVIWRNLVRLNKKHVLCIDRLIVRGEATAIIYLIVSGKMGKHRGVFYDVAVFENTELLASILNWHRETSVQTLELNSIAN